VVALWFGYKWWNARRVVVCCASGTRSGMARLKLKKNGYGQVFNIGKWTNLLR
jgi:phage shock protein E